MGDPQFFVLESRDDDRETRVFDPVIFSMPGSGQVDLVTNAMDQGEPADACGVHLVPWLLVSAACVFASIHIGTANWHIPPPSCVCGTLGLVAIYSSYDVNAMELLDCQSHRPPIWPPICCLLVWHAGCCFGYGFCQVGV